MATTGGSDGELRVGALAAAAGLTVRALHHYEEIGLLVPSRRSASGHRVYDEVDVARLYRVLLLRKLGLPLRDIARSLDDPAWETRPAMRRHRHHVEERIRSFTDIRARLDRLLATDGASTTRDMLALLEEMTMVGSPLQERISFLVYTDIAAAFEYLERVFLLGPGQLTRDEDGDVVHAEIRAGDGVVWLHPESPQFGLASPRSAGVATAGTAVMVDDVDAHYEHAAAEGATIVYEPLDQPYGYREYSARDLEGGLWSFMKPSA